MPEPAKVLEFPSRSSERLRDGGYVPLYRREFTEGDSVLGHDRQLIGAWIEMFATARWQDDPVEVMVGGTMVTLGHGQLILNYRVWAERWGVSASKLYRACKAMEKDGRIRLEVKQLRNSHETACTIVTICNFDRYRASSEAGEKALEQPWNVTKEGKELKKVNSEIRTNSEASSDTQSPTPTATASQHAVTPPSDRIAKRGTRIGNWKPSPEMQAFAIDRGIPKADLREVFRTFRDYWIAQPGQRGVKLDWDATWRNWTRKDGASRAKNGHARTAADEPWGLYT